MAYLKSQSGKLQLWTVAFVFPWMIVSRGRGRLLMGLWMWLYFRGKHVHRVWPEMMK